MMACESDQPHGTAPCDEQLRIDEFYMARAVRLARNGIGWVNPNPLVGAVVVKNGRIIGQGWHRAYGDLHAERHALANCTDDPRGATIYVTLEPCCHTGKQPPCTEALIEAGLARVVMGSDDPNPEVAGRGVAQLQKAGIEVTRGVLRRECDELNRAFFHYIQTGKPYVILKYAMTLDGKIATRSGKSKWITGEVARRRVHEDRQRYAAIMVGVGTVLADDPLLTCRLDDFADADEDDGQLDRMGEARYEALLEEELAAEEAAWEAEFEGEAPFDEDADGAAFDADGDKDSADTPAAGAGCCFDNAAVGADAHGVDVGANAGIDAETPLPPCSPKTSNPLRIVCDTHLRTPLKSRIVQTAASVPTCIATCVTDVKKHMPYREHECDILVVPEAAGHLDMEELMAALGRMGIDSVIVEGGAEINWSVLAFETASAVQAYIAPKIFGGAKAPSPVAGFGVEAPPYAIELSEPRVTRLGDDLLVECEVI